MKTIRNTILSAWHLVLLVAAVIYSASCKPLTPDDSPLNTFPVPTVTPESEGRFGQSNKGVTW